MNMKKGILLKSKISRIPLGFSNFPLGRKIIFLFLILGILFTSGCKENCESGLYTSDGKCCTYVCDISCDSYKEGTCNCECGEASGLDIGDTNIDDIFEDATDIEPPSIPI